MKLIEATIFATFFLVIATVIVFLGSMIGTLCIGLFGHMMNAAWDVTWFTIEPKDVNPIVDVIMKWWIRGVTILYLPFVYFLYDDIKNS